jgi:hypothetical protein
MERDLVRAAIKMRLPKLVTPARDHNAKPSLTTVGQRLTPWSWEPDVTLTLAPSPEHVCSLLRQ